MGGVSDVAGREGRVPQAGGGVFEALGIPCREMQRDTALTQGLRRGHADAAGSTVDHNPVHDRSHSLPDRLGKADHAAVEPVRPHP